MNAVDFCFWLQGHFELSNSSELSEDQVKVIRNHLNLVFEHQIDPMRESETTATKEELDTAHDGVSQAIDPGNDPRVRC